MRRFVKYISQPVLNLLLNRNCVYGLVPVTLAVGVTAVFIPLK